MEIYWNLSRITGTLHEDMCTFMIISRWILLGIRKVSDKPCTENQSTYRIFLSIFFFRTSCCLCGKNVVQPDSPQMTIYCCTEKMRFAPPSRISKARIQTHWLIICNSHCCNKQHVILCSATKMQNKSIVRSPWQQWTLSYCWHLYLHR
jgi:hypothetical protein